MKTHLPDPQLDLVQAAGLSYLTDPRLFGECGIRIGFTNRAGGVSTGPFASLNLGAHTDDDPEHIRANRAILQESVEAIDVEFIHPTQVHGDEVLVVDASSSIALVQERASEGADGILVTCPNVAPLLCFADCVPVIVVAPRAFAVVHAGWRGVMARIAPKAVAMLLERVPDLDASDLNVYIGPHIGGPCFETSAELAASFADAFGEGVRLDERHVDLSRALASSLEEVGVCDERIIDAGACTVCSNEDYFSYRAQGGTCGRHGAFCFRKG